MTVARRFKKSSSIFEFIWDIQPSISFLKTITTKFSRFWDFQNEICLFFVLPILLEILGISFRFQFYLIKPKLSKSDQNSFISLMILKAQKRRPQFGNGNTKCYLYQMLSIQNVTYTKCYLDEMLLYENVLYEMLLYENVLYEMLLIRIFVFKSVFIKTTYSNV